MSLASITELFRVRKNVSGDLLKSLASIRTISLDDIKKTLINNVYGKRLKCKPKQGYKYNVSKKIGPRKRVESQDDIKVLYSFERPKSPPDPDINIPPKNSYKRNNILRRSSSDLFGIARARRDTYLCYHTTRNTGLFPTPKRRKKRTESTPHIVHQVYPLSITNRKSKDLRFQREALSDHYNVVGFPKTSKVNVDEHRPKPHKCVARHREVSPRPSTAMYVTMDCKGHTSNAKRTSAAVLTEPISKCMTCIKKITSCHDRTPARRSNICCTIFQILCNIKCPKVLQTTLRYLLLVLSIIAWSPCIIAVGFCWLLVYPLKPNYVFEDDKELDDDETCCKKKSAFTKVMDWIAKTSQRMASSIREIHRLLMNKEECCIESPNIAQASSAPCQITAVHKKSRTPWQPCPDRKYILYFDSVRGWLMKPVRNEICEKCKRAEVVQNLSLDHPHESPSRPNRAVTFSDTMHQDKGNIVSREFIHKCKCPPKTAHKSNANVCTQTTCRKTENRLPKCGICVDPDDILIQRIDKKPDPKKGRKKKSVFCAYRPPIHKKTSKMPKGKSLKCRKCKPRTRAPFASMGPRLNMNPRGPFQSRATALYSKEEDEPDRSLGQRFCDSCKSCAHSLKEVVTEADKVWDVEMTCNNMYIQTLKKRPCFWIYHCCKSMYPAFLAFHKLCSNACYVCTLLFGICVWCPLLLCCYGLSWLVCGCN
ncbi:uncharacterized protein LOC114361842 isoform X2 [Ostrinia furnacalis]|nr:uncharacterized protein LOC114361842 isoform X2 [Ostrinia furnacalis]